MAAYITISQFEDMGGSADEAAFSRLELKARRLIDAATHGRIQDENPVREAVKMCAFELIAMFAASESTNGVGGKEVASASNDGVSISYTASEGQSMAARQKAIIRDWLGGETTQSGVSLLYCGVDA